MLSYPSRRAIRYVSAEKIIANSDFYYGWALRSARRLSAYDLYATSYLFEQLAAIRGFAYAVRVMGVQE